MHFCHYSICLQFGVSDQCGRGEAVSAFRDQGGIAEAVDKGELTEVALHGYVI